MKTDKTTDGYAKRSFLIEALPEPLTRASSHLQIFDNYLGETALRLRSIRVPETREWVRSLQQVKPRQSDSVPEITAEIFLDEDEYAQLEHLEGNEVRKNRYFYLTGEQKYSFDVYLGPLWGLNVLFADISDVSLPSESFPEIRMIAEITARPEFFGRNLVGKDLAYIRTEAARLIGDSGEGTASAG